MFLRHRIERRLPRIFSRPDSLVTGRNEFITLDSGEIGLDNGVLDSGRRRLSANRLAEEVLFLGWCQRRVAVRRADHAELVGFSAKLLFKNKAVLQRLAGIFACEHLGLFQDRQPP